MYTIRQAIEDDSAQLAALRPILDAETENMDREPGEAHLDEAAWRAIIARDKAENNHLFWWRRMADGWWPIAAVPAPAWSACDIRPSLVYAS